MKQFCYQLLCTYAGNEERVRFTNPAGEVGTYFAYVYSYGGSLGWHVPKDFDFPVHCNLEVDWKLWLIGLPTPQVKEGGQSCTSLTILDAESKII